jgi:hypothetical protein
VVHLSTLCFCRLYLKLLPHLYLDLPSGPFVCYMNHFIFISFFLHVFQISCPSLALLFSHTDIWWMVLYNGNVQSNLSVSTPLKFARCILRFCPVIFVPHLLQIVTKFTYNLTSKQSPRYSVLREGIFLASAGVVALLPSQSCFVRRLVSGVAIYCGLVP